MSEGEETHKGSLKELALYIFSNQHQQLQLYSDETDNEYMFGMLSSLLLEGIYVMYGKAFELDQLTRILRSVLDA